VSVQARTEGGVIIFSVIGDSIMYSSWKSSTKVLSNDAAAPSTITVIGG